MELEEHLSNLVCYRGHNAAALKRNRTLTELSLVGTGLTAAHAEALASCAERNRLAQAEEAG